MSMLWETLLRVASNVGERKEKPRLRLSAGVQVLSRRVLSCHVESGLDIPQATKSLVLSRPVMSRLVLSRLVQSGRVPSSLGNREPPFGKSCRVLSRLVLSRRVLSRHVASGLITVNSPTEQLQRFTNSHR